MTKSKTTDTYDELVPLEEELFDEDKGYPALHSVEGLSHHSSTYTPEQKLQAVTYYTVLGSLLEVSKRLGINYNTIRRWKRESPWWEEAMARIRATRNDKLDAKLSNQMELLLTELEDRIVHGDEVLTKDGGTRRLKMKGKDLGVTYAVLQDKRGLLRGDMSSITREGNKTQNELLVDLKKSFEKLSDTLNKKNEKVIN